MKRPEALDLDALRTFVTGIDAGNYAIAAQRLSRSTSAVSAQLKKLEAQCDRQLLQKEGRGLTLTQDGELLLSYARRLLAVNDEALLALKQRQMDGKVTIGFQEDFSDILIPNLLGRFCRAYPAVEVEAQSGRNRMLTESVECCALDYALCWEAPDQYDADSHVAELPLYWIGLDETIVINAMSSGDPLPLVMLEAPCVIRNMAIEALDNANIPWRMSFTSGSLSSVWAATRAGMGVTVRSSVGMPTSLKYLVSSSLPSLPQLGLSLKESKTIKGVAQTTLKSLLMEELQASIA
ncbi:LysR substrate-binding domain-containing protein [Vibrio viridaestus]|uniref:LysR family transcriptional regulator n=1 Tax=Vibrio viridaestus TaxID=2487322 RepID=A0A3N9U643_9VIBR|nr:LysR substrate-binding domain-containing protein [Vibrio viridaestus]RQW63536.1 LysR family transcriptional regulator [Vibrio viridaestus]